MSERYVLKHRVDCDGIHVFAWDTINNSLVFDTQITCYLITSPTFLDKLLRRSLEDKFKNACNKIQNYVNSLNEREEERKQNCKSYYKQYNEILSHTGSFKKP